MKSNEISFARNLVKGKIAETVFAQMLRSTEQFTVLEFGSAKQSSFGGDEKGSGSTRQ